MATDVQEQPAMIHGAIIALMEEMSPVGKTGFNAHQRYNFRGIDAIRNEINPLLSKHGVYVVPRLLRVERDERTTQQGGVMRCARVEVEFSYYAKDGSRIVSVTEGEAMDTGDKASSKAQTDAFKKSLEQVFCIPTGEPEIEDGDPKPQPKRAPFQPANVPAEPAPKAAPAAPAARPATPPQQAARPTTPAPQQQQAPPADTSGENVGYFTVTGTKALKTGKQKDGTPYTLWGIECVDDQGQAVTLRTFEDAIAATAHAGEAVEIRYISTRYGMEAKSITPASGPAPDDVPGPSEPPQSELAHRVQAVELKVEKTSAGNQQVFYVTTDQGEYFTTDENIAAELRLQVGKDVPVTFEWVKHPRGQKINHMGEIPF